jgi:transposase-like protein
MSFIRPECTKERVIDLYAQGYTMKQVGEMVGKHRDWVSRLLHRNNVQVRKRNGASNLDGVRLVGLYDEGYSAREVGDLLGVATRTVLDYMERHGIPRRTLSEANRGGFNRCKHHVFTVEKVCEARLARLHGATWSDLEKRYPWATPTTIKRAVRGISWAHVPMPSVCSNESVADAAE